MNGRKVYGFNYNVRTAVNDIEQRQATTFDLKTIDQEFGWAEKIGYTSVRVFLSYYGITGNARALGCFLMAVHRAWRKWLDRRNCLREMTWDRFNRLLKRYPLPPPRIVHSYVK
ncbi:MAG: hypothetical protein ACLP9L_01305 [Thermoguttaceae bacterium]